jgi:hypothetical protein
MSYAFRVGQLVGLAQTFRDLGTYEVVQRMPETPSGEPQYRIKGLSGGTACCARGRDPAARLRSPRLLSLRRPARV